MTKNNYIQQMQLLNIEYEKLKKTILSMCDDLDAEKDISKKEAIKISIETNRERIIVIESTCTDILELIQKQYARH